MKLSRVFKSTAILTVFFLFSCRGGDEQITDSTDPISNDPTTSFTGGPVTPPPTVPPTPPKDVPKDYDDWRMGNTK